MQLLTTSNLISCFLLYISAADLYCSQVLAPSDFPAECLVSQDQQSRAIGDYQPGNGNSFGRADEYSNRQINDYRFRQQQSQLQALILNPPPYHRLVYLQCNPEPLFYLLVLILPVILRVPEVYLGVQRSKTSSREELLSIKLSYVLHVFLTYSALSQAPFIRALLVSTSCHLIYSFSSPY